jgi:hypothetical protein
VDVYCVFVERSDLAVIAIEGDKQVESGDETNSLEMNRIDSYSFST